jgi:DNA-binding XRE family transcriptional regulator
VLQWSQSELARRAGVARKTVADFEKETRRLQIRTRRDIGRALEQAGIRFDVDDGGRCTAVQFQAMARQTSDGASSL